MISENFLLTTKQKHHALELSAWCSDCVLGHPNLDVFVTSPSCYSPSVEPRQCKPLGVPWLGGESEQQAESLAAGHMANSLVSPPVEEGVVFSAH